MPYGFLLVLLAEGATLVGFLLSIDSIGSVRNLNRTHDLLLFCELLFHSAIVYFLGGLSWLGPVAYLFAVMYATVFLSRKQAIIFTASVIAAFVITIALDSGGVLPHQWYLPQGADRYRQASYVVTSVIAFAGVVGTIAFWMMFLGGEMRRERDIALHANAELLKAQEELRRLNEELEQKVRERTRTLAYQAERDQLTGLLNRGAATRHTEELLALARRGDRPLALLIADGDGFKLCNDRCGHEFGDGVLVAIADALRKTARESDLVGRLGGDEFVVVLPDTSARGALRFCRRLSRAINCKRRSWNGPMPLPTVSVGVSVFPEHGADLDELMRVADKAMYEAKAIAPGTCKVGRPGATFGAEVAATPAEAKSGV